VKRFFLFFYSIVFSLTLVGQQKVGLVLSGGAANGIAHIGVLKALEEHEIPIDYITGTSIGALIGSLYASGYSPEAIETMFTSERFINMSKGQIEKKYQYFFKRKPENASWISIKISKDTIIQTSIPTSVISPVAIDFELMNLLSSSAAAANYNFDNLFVPFRCVASDVENKETVIFKDGHLNQAVRASLSYPFYLKPIKINNKILFDGGLYNNFPSDIMYDHFFPDVIIGSNVSYNYGPPKENDVISFIKNMMVAKTDYNVICEKGVLIEPKTNVNTFEFKNIEGLIQIGYLATLEKIDEIKKHTNQRISKEEITKKRQEYLSKKPKLVFSQVDINGLNTRQTKYILNSLRPNKKSNMSIDDIKPRYFKVISDEQINYIYPTAEYDSTNKNYKLKLQVKKEKDIKFEFGGNFSSRPINMAYIGLRYNYLGKTAISIGGNSYFGKLYGSSQLNIRWDLPVALPFYLQLEYTMNRWDFFKSAATFFEDVKPSFLIQNEKFLEGTIGMPIGSNARIIGGISTFSLKDNYYQTQFFTNRDTTDITYFDGNSIFIKFEYGTLNKKQFSSKGSKFNVNLRLIEGEEFEIPGSTSLNKRTFRKYHQWYHLRATYQNYYKEKGNLRLGIYAEGCLSNQPLFHNYTASNLRAPAFQPIPDSKTLFLESFRAFNYVAFGHQIIYNIKNNFEIRLAGFVLQPYKEILNQNELGKEFDKRYTILSGTTVYHTPIGPVSFGVNYYYNEPNVSPDKKAPITYTFNIGYILFNNHALD
jgi:NTE family protein